MLESNNEASGSETASSAAVDQAQEGEASNKLYDSKFVEKLLKEKKNQSAHLQELKAFKEKYEQEELIKKEQFSRVLEIKDQQLNELKTKVDSFQTREIEAKKTMAIVGELKKLGFIDDQANREIVLKLIDKAPIEIDPTTNVVLGADMAAKSFYDKYNHFPIFGKKAVKTSMEAPNYAGSMSPKKVEDLNKDERAKRLKESLTNLLGR